MNTNTTPRLRHNRNRVDFQLASDEGESLKDFTTKHSSTFSITIKSDKDGEPPIYENKEESYTYESVESIHNALKYFGATLDDSKMQFINQALAGSEDTGKAVKKIVDLVNSKLKADAKSNRYQSLVNQHKPLEGEKKESAMARLVLHFSKLAGVSVASAIETMKAGGALPADFTESDMVPLRRTKGESDE